MLISICEKFFSVSEIFYTKLSENNILGIRNVPLRLFFNNHHLRFCCQIITYGHHLSKNIITSQFSQFSFFAVNWRKLTFWAISQPNNTIWKSQCNKKFLCWPCLTLRRVWNFSSPDLSNRVWLELLKFSSSWYNLLTLRGSEISRF